MSETGTRTLGGNAALQSRLIGLLVSLHWGTHPPPPPPPLQPRAMHDGYTKMTDFTAQTSVADPWHFGTDPDPHLWLRDRDSDPDPNIFVSDLQDGNWKLIFCQSFFVSYRYSLKLHLHHFSKIKSHKEVTKQKESRFFLLFLLDDRRIRIRSRTSYVLMDRILRIRTRNTSSNKHKLMPQPLTYSIHQ